MSGKREPFILVLGDLFFLATSLWLSLLIRELEIPSREFFLTHLVPFSLLFIVWIVVFYIAGLYEKHTIILKNQLPTTLANTQLVNSTLAVAFFYFIPFFKITPKTILFIYLAISFVVMLLWRQYGYFLIGRGKVSNAVLIGNGEEVKEIMEEVNSNPIYNLNFITSVDLGRDDAEVLWREVVSRIYAEDVSLVVINLSDEKVEPILPHLYNLIFSNIDFLDMYKVYENIFDRVPLSLLKYNWFLENISTQPRGVYDTLKRFMDIVAASLLLLLSLPFDIFAAISIKLDDGGPIFIVQERIGKNNKPIKIFKFRTMSTNDNGLYAEETAKLNKVTRIGSFLRKSRIDEFPQFLNVIMGQLSLVGPRPELPTLVRQYEEEVPYYNIRHLIKPGISGWAQIYHDGHPHHRPEVLETKRKLSYDLYYIQNRSLFLDIKIALRTIKTMLSREGR